MNEQPLTSDYLPPGSALAKCGRPMIRRDAGFLGWVWGCPVHSEHWAWPGATVDPNVMETRAAVARRSGLAADPASSEASG